MLQLVARGLVVPPDSVKNMTAAQLESTARKFAPRSFAVAIDGLPGLDDTTLPYYEVNT